MTGSRDSTFHVAQTVESRKFKIIALKTVDARTVSVTRETNDVKQELFAGIVIGDKSFVKLM